MYDKLTPLLTLIGVVYIKSINPKLTMEELEQYRDMLRSLVREYFSHIKNGTEPDIQIIKK